MQRHARLVQGVRDPVRQERLDAPVGEEHLRAPHAPRGRVALQRRGEVLADLPGDARECVEPEHQGEKNGVLM